MKFDLIVKDLSEAQLSEALQKLKAGAVAGSNYNPAPAAPAPITPAPIAHIATPADDENDEGGVDDGNPYDATGLPWDERIHASSKAKTAKGIWKSRKNVDKTLKAQIENELRTGVKAALIPAGGTPYIDPSLPAHAYPAPVMMHDTATQYAAPAPVPAPVSVQPQYVAPAPVAPQPAAAPAGPVTFPDVLNLFQQKLAAGRIQHTFLGELVGVVNTQFGTQCNAITDINGNQPMTEFAYNVLSSK